MGKITPRIHDLVGCLNTLFPPELAEEWDNVGLQVGDPAIPFSKGVVALDPDMGAVLAACEAGAQVLITHHPLLFRSLKRLTPEDETGRILFHAIQNNLVILSAHTNLDSAQPGLNSWLADLLDVHNTSPLKLSPGHLLKLVVYVPAGHETEVADALFAAGAGHVGQYDQCSFRQPGTGTFRPGEDSSPFIGEIGRCEEVNELRLEVIVPRSRLNKVLSRLLKVHPYEDVAYDLIPLENKRNDVGLGRVGRLENTLSLQEFSERVRQKLGCDTLRVVGSAEQSVRKIALCGGSGASLISTAHRCGADVLVTGDIKYHEAKTAEALGIALVDAGHFATEVLMTGHLTQLLNDAAEQNGWEATFQAYDGAIDPFRTV